MRSGPAAQVARSAALVLLAAVAATGCGGYEPLDVGQCLPEGAGVEGVREAEPEVVACTQEHRYEVYARRDLDPPSGDWPGTDLVDLNAERLCGLAVEEATGRPIEDLPDGVTVVRVAPTESSWADGDREVECLFRLPEPTTDTLVPG